MQNDKLVIWEVLKLMTENPNRMAKSKGGTICFTDGDLVWKHDGSLFSIHTSSNKYWDTLRERAWTIIEPSRKLKKMNIINVIKYYSNSTNTPNILSRNIVSVQTGRNLDDSYGFSYLTNEEIDGMWTIEGVYED